MKSKESIQIKEAVRFTRNADRKSTKAKEVRAVLVDYKANRISESEAIKMINNTKPWQTHGPLNS